MISKLIDGEKVYYYISGGGCLGFKPKTYFMISSNRVLFSGKESEGCLGIFVKTYDHALPLEHISSISSVT